MIIVEIDPKRYTTKTVKIHSGSINLKPEAALYIAETVNVVHQINQIDNNLLLQFKNGQQFLIRKFFSHGQLLFNDARFNADQIHQNILANKDLDNLTSANNFYKKDMLSISASEQAIEAKIPYVPVGELFAYCFKIESSLTSDAMPVVQINNKYSLPTWLHLDNLGNNHFLLYGKPRSSGRLLISISLADSTINNDQLSPFHQFSLLIEPGQEHNEAEAREEEEAESIEDAEVANDEFVNTDSSRLGNYNFTLLSSSFIPALLGFNTPLGVNSQPVTSVMKMESNELISSINPKLLATSDRTLDPSIYTKSTDFLGQQLNNLPLNYQQHDNTIIDKHVTVTHTEETAKFTSNNHYANALLMPNSSGGQTTSPSLTNNTSDSSSSHTPSDQTPTPSATTASNSNIAQGQLLPSSQTDTSTSSASKLISLFTNSGENINFNTIPTSSNPYDHNSYYNSLGGDDHVTLPQNTLIANALGYDANNEFHGGPGDDTIIGGNLNDKIYGDAGNDYIDGGSGINQLYGGDGNDILVFDPQALIIDGGVGTDKVLFNQHTDAFMTNVNNITSFQNNPNHVDFTITNTNLSNIEIIDLNGNNSTLTLTPDAIHQISGIPDGSQTSIQVDGQAGNSVTLEAITNSSGLLGEWNLDSSYINSNYNHFIYFDGSGTVTTSIYINKNVFVETP